ncbi:SbcC/MukB-like Walker B domain-containing protein, partial [Streptomyces sp. SID3343]|uniref:SbcC/MukB-like Walker B domain-containing protein n=1 Tax=Streptomyces sp. SID3343 TaxID=2690260 RepID=UPI0013C1FAB1
EAAADHRAAEDDSRERRQRLLRELDEHATAVAARRETHARALAVVVELQRGEAAFVAGEGLSAGRPCPVCTHTLAPDYTPPAPLSAHALNSARHDADECARALHEAVAAHDRIEVHAAQADADGEGHRARTRSALDRLDRELGRLHDDAEALAVQIPEAIPSPGLFATQLTERVASTASWSIDGSPHTDPAASALLMDEVTAAARACEQHAVTAATDAADAATEAAADLRASRKALDRRGEDLRRERTALAHSERQLAANRAGFGAELDNLPAGTPAAPASPDALPSLDDITSAADAVAERLARLQSLTRARDLASADLHALAARDNELTRLHHESVTEPLRELGVRLRRWAEAAGEAAHLLGAEPLAPSLAFITAADPATMDEQAAVLRETSDRLRETLAAAQSAAGHVVTEFERTIAAHASTASRPESDGGSDGGSRGGRDGDDDGNDTGFDVSPSRAALLSPALLDPLSQQVSAARSEADHARERLRIARSQIPHFTALHEALGSGRAQHSAWVGLCKQLTDATFLGYLTERRTRALLGIGSALLQQLSAGRLGFAENFRIVNRLTGTARGAKTLSGGETFLASLALSLALVELHGRSSTHLESLFLDEGFGTLDSGTLESALTVLRSHVAGDRLVTVISHLHQVAETVDDVLWVDKQPVGSTARWLTDRERATLVHNDVNGLADLA